VDTSTNQKITTAGSIMIYHSLVALAILIAKHSRLKKKQNFLKNTFISYAILTDMVLQEKQKLRLKNLKQKENGGKMNKTISSEYQETLRWVEELRKETKSWSSLRDELKEERLHHYDVIASALNVAMGLANEKEMEQRQQRYLFRNGERVKA